MKNNIILLKTIILIIFTIQSCTNNKSKTQNVEMDNQVPQTIFLSFEISKKNKNDLAIKLIEKIVVDGTIKKNKAAISNPKKGDFKCMELDERKNVIQSFYLTNPLNKRVEYVNDDGELESKNVALDTTQLLIRMQLHQQTHAIELEQVTDKSNKTKALINIQLN